MDDPQHLEPELGDASVPGELIELHLELEALGLTAETFKEVFPDEAH